MSDKDGEAFEKWLSDNNWMKGDLKEAWQAACEYKDKSLINGTRMKQMNEEIERLKAENTKLRECVEFYANETSWDDIGGNCLSNVISSSDIEHIIGDTVIGGKRARQVLKELENK